MKVILLAGGKGTRLAPYNTVFPKPLVPLGDYPIIDIIIRQLLRHEFNDITISLGYLAELIIAYFESSKKRYGNNAKINFVREKKPLGTVGAFSLIPKLDETFMSINGDILTTLDYRKLLKFHKSKGGILTVAVSRRDIKIDYGVVKYSKDHRIIGIDEKPHYNFDVGMGIYVFEPEVLKYIPYNKHLDFPDLVKKLLDAGEKVVAYPNDNFWLDLGSHQDYSKAQDEFEKMKDELLG